MRTTLIVLGLIFAAYGLLMMILLLYIGSSTTEQFVKVMLYVIADVLFGIFFEILAIIAKPKP